MNQDRSWTVLFLGGPSGTGKSRLAYGLARHYGVNVMEVDDVFQAIKAVTAAEHLPAVHRWGHGPGWKEVGVAGNVAWLQAVSREIAPALKAIAQDHLESQVPVIIEGDFISPELALAFSGPAVAFLFVIEPEEKQILQNYQAREGGALQYYRAEISKAYGQWLGETGAKTIRPRPWDTGIARAIGLLGQI